jgi:hypothetical protein
VADDPFDHRPVDDRQHLLRRAERQRTQTGAEPTDEDDRFHGPLALELPEAVVVVGVEFEALDEGAPLLPLFGDELGGTLVVDRATSLTLEMRSATSGFAGMVESFGMNAMVNDSFSPRRILSKPSVKIWFGLLPFAASVA